MLVNTENFVKKMDERWRAAKPDGLGLHSYPALLEAWALLADTLNENVEGGNAATQRWSVIPLPTGTGKTQGLALYCAMTGSLSIYEHPGILIITRFTDEADKLVELINQLYRELFGGKGGIACTFHTNLEDENERELKNEDTRVLVITHSAYIRIMDAELNAPKPSKWDQYIGWPPYINGGNTKHNHRKLTVIDESLDVINDIQVHLDEIRVLRSLLPYEEQSNHQEVLEFLDGVIQCMIGMRRDNDFGDENRIRLTDLITDEFWRNVAVEPPHPKLINGFKLSLKRTGLDALLAGKSSEGLRQDILRKHDSTIDNLVAIASDWSWYAKKGNHHILSSPYVSLPTYLPSAVVLDATAQYHHIYEMMEEYVKILPIPENLRSYQNVNLIIRAGYHVGKSSLSKYPRRHFLEVVEKVKDAYGEDIGLLACVHKVNEGNFKKAKGKFDPAVKAFKAFDVGHWGGLDGKNQWQDMDTMVVYGLPYLDSISPNNAILAFKKWIAEARIARQCKDRIKEYEEQGFSYDKAVIYAISASDNRKIPPEGVYTSDLRDKRLYKEGHILTSLIQAMNRIRCRRIVDEHGNCDETNIVLYVDTKRTASSYAEKIQKMMPGIKIIHEVNPDLENKIGRMTKSESAVFDFLRKAKQGSYPLTYIREEVKKQTNGNTDMSEATMQRVVRSFKSGETLFAQNCNMLGIQYEAEKGPGGNRAFIVL